jgi:hypothetical protein
MRDENSRSAFEMREETKLVASGAQADVGNRRDEMMLAAVSLCVYSDELHDVGVLVRTRNNDMAFMLQSELIDSFQAHINPWAGKMQLDYHNRIRGDTF